MTPAPGWRPWAQRSGSHREPARASGIVAFELAGRDPLATKKTLLAQDVVVSCRAGRLRISPHAYTSEEDLDRLIAGLSH